jgi:hypothetical protein
MPMRRRAFFSPAALAGLAVFATTVASCLSPTLPLPPPQPETVASETGGQWVVAGNCLPGAIVTVFNATTFHGVVVEDVAHAGHYSASLAGSQCDAAWVSQETDDGESGQVSFSLQATANGFPLDSNACP